MQEERKRRKPFFKWKKYKAICYRQGNIFIKYSFDGTGQRNISWNTHILPSEETSKQHVWTGAVKTKGMGVLNKSAAFIQPKGINAALHST